MKVKQIKYVIFALMCMCVTPLITHAECDYQRKAELSRMASNVQLSYIYDANYGFQVILTNLTNDLYTIDNYGNVIYGGKEHSFDFASGKISFDIYSSDSNCSGKLTTKSIDLPTVNSFSYYSECNQYPQFKYCQLWGDFAISDEQFNVELKEYKNNINKKTYTKNDKESVLDVVLDVFNKNLFMIIFFGIVIIVTVIIKIVCLKRKK